MRLVFAGTPEPAVASLRALIASPHEVVAVISRPDARVGRGRNLSRSPVAALADEAGIPVLTPRSLRDTEVQEQLRAFEPDCCPVVAYGGLVPDAALTIPKHGWVNLHFSLLPAWRGAAPVQAAIAAGDDVIGATTFQIDSGLDTGPVFGTLTETIRPSDTAGALLERLSHAGAQLLLATMDGLESGELSGVPQPGHGVSHAAKVSVDDARIVWTRPAHIVDRQIRSVTPQPGAWTVVGEARIKVGEARLEADSDATLAPGELQVTKKALLVGTGSAAMQLVSVQPPGKKMMSALDWARGARLEPGVIAQ